MNEYGETENEIEVQNAFDASERYSEFGDYYARASLSGELIGPYDSSDSRDDDLRDSIREYLAELPFMPPEGWDEVQERIDMEISDDYLTDE